MANKITKDTMKRLIEEVMKESKLPKVNPIAFLKNTIKIVPIMGTVPTSTQLLIQNYGFSEEAAGEIAKYVIEKGAPYPTSKEFKDMMANYSDGDDTDDAGDTDEPEKDEPELIPLSGATTGKGLSNESTKADFQKVLSNITNTMKKGTIDTLKDIFNAIVKDFKALFSSAPKTEQDAFDAKVIELNKVDDKTTSDPLVVALTNKLSGQNPAIPDPSPKYSKAIAAIPDDFKNVILRNFKVLLDPDDSGDDETFKDIASIAESTLRENVSQLGWEDFATILLNPSSKLYRPALLTIKQVANAYPAQQWAQSLKSVAAKQDALPKPSPTGKPKYATMNVDVSDLQGRDRTKVPSYIIDIFNNLGLANVSTVKERIEILNNMTEKIVDPNTPLNKDDALLSEVMSAIGVVNSLSRIVKNMDDKAAGWAFESFLAQLANGTTEGTAMGAADFQFGIAPGGDYGDVGKVPGSAKLIAKDDSSQAFSTMGALLSKTARPNVPKDTSKTWSPKQRRDAAKALSGYGSGTRLPSDPTNPNSLTKISDENLLARMNKVSWGNDTVVYILGRKVDSSGSGTADPSKITAIKLNMIKIQRTAGEGVMNKVAPSSYKTKGGTVSTMKSGSGSKFGFKVEENKTLGTLYLSNSVEDLARLSNNALKIMDNNLPELIKQIEGFQRDSQSYLATGNASKIESALDSYTSLFGLINSVFGDPTGKAAESSGKTATVKTTGTGIDYDTAALAEQKITANFLKKLISESFKR